MPTFWRVKLLEAIHNCRKKLVRCLVSESSHFRKFEGSTVLLEKGKTFGTWETLLRSLWEGMRYLGPHEGH